MFPRSLRLVAVLIVLVAAGLSARHLILRFGFLRAPARPAVVRGAIDIAFDDIVAQDFRNDRATHCNLMAVIDNATHRRISDLTFRIGRNEFRLFAVLPGELNAKINIGSIDLSDANSTCADEALSILNNVAHASVMTCGADDMTPDRCRSLVHLSTRMDAGAIERIRYDEGETGRRNLAAIAAAVPAEIAFITDRIDNRSVNARSADGAATADVIVVNDTQTRFYDGGGPQGGWHEALRKRCARLPILNKGGLAGFNAILAQSDEAYRSIPAGYVWYARQSGDNVWYGQVRAADIAPAIFVAKCDEQANLVELQLPHIHADGTPLALK